jgi:glycosyltransferase involved in cell wall biosynthesis
VVPALPRRVLLVSQPVDAGVPRHVLDLVLEADPQRYTFVVACPPRSELWNRLEGRGNVTLRAIGPSRLPQPSDLLSLLRLLPLVRSADVVHAHSSKAGMLARAAALCSGATGRCIYTPHGWAFWAYGGAAGSVFAVLERAAARWCAAIVTVSRHERDEGLRRRVGRPAQYRVVQNGVDVGRFSADPRPTPGRVVMVGRLAEPKRPDEAVRAVAALRPKVHDAHLLLVGDGPQEDAVRRLAAELGVESAVELLGRRDDVAGLLAGASCFLLASRYEGCPLSVLEAMAAGLPVVVTRLGGIDEVVEHGRTGLVVDPDAAAIADALETLLSDPERAARMGAEARRVARSRFSRPRMAAETIALWDATGRNDGQARRGAAGPSRRRRR